MSNKISNNKSLTDSVIICLLEKHQEHRRSKFQNIEILNIKEPKESNTDELRLSNHFVIAKP